MTQLCLGRTGFDQDDISILDNIIFALGEDLTGCSYGSFITALF